MKTIKEFFDHMDVLVKSTKTAAQREWEILKQEIIAAEKRQQEAKNPQPTPNPDKREGWLTKTDRITRVEVIDEKGRAYVNWQNNNRVKVAFQDEGRTMKIFINTMIFICIIFLSACSSSQYVTIPPGVYMDKAGHKWSPPNTDLTKPYDLYMWQPKKNKYRVLFKLQNQ